MRAAAQLGTLAAARHERTPVEPRGAVPLRGFTAS